jgi:hypothetical protein
MATLHLYLRVISTVVTLPRHDYGNTYRKLVKEGLDSKNCMCSLKTN